MGWVKWAKEELLIITINKKPRFSGEKIPITGNSALSYDEK
jgi:hypothetical protein